MFITQNPPPGPAIAASSCGHPQCFYSTPAACSQHYCNLGHPVLSQRPGGSGQGSHLRVTSLLLRERAFCAILCPSSSVPRNDPWHFSFLDIAWTSASVPDTLGTPFTARRKKETLSGCDVSAVADIRIRGNAFCIFPSTIKNLYTLCSQAEIYSVNIWSWLGKSHLSSQTFRNFFHKDTMTENCTSSTLTDKDTSPDLFTKYSK